MPTFHIHIEGQVQGVGFRPFVYKLAVARGLTGWVNNTVDGVHIEITAPAPAAGEFYQALLQQAPRLACITAHRMWPVEEQAFERFDIITSEVQGRPRLLLSPDFALCADCRQELGQPGNRRYGYPFITCTNCGPRFSIVEALPYDRERTTMRPFRQCPACQAEYDDPLDRRYYSQTNSCDRCGIHLALYEASGRRLSGETDNLLQQTVAAVADGAIVAVKGIGGFLLLCDATNAEPVRRLRDRKARPSKPFALLYPDVATLRQDVELSPSAEAALLSPAAPIVLTPLLPVPKSGIRADAVAPGLSQIGVMLPYAPLYELLLRELRRPVVATSGNVSHSPIIFEDERALSDLAPLADYLLVHDRLIVVPQDDSVLRFSPVSQTPILLRRSRGLAPTLILPQLALPPGSRLAMGADLKSTFTLLQQQNTYVSQYLGDLDSYDTQRHYRHTLDHFLRLFSAQPEVVLVDRHPNYFSTRLGEELAGRWSSPIRRLQHHLAHFAACLGEHNLLQVDRPVLGVIWDGVGLGDDGQIWGGEFFRFRQGRFSREGQLAYFDHLGGDKMSREPRLSALCLGRGLEEVERRLRPKFSEVEWRIFHHRLERSSGLQTSSMGRLFDAAASLLGLMDVATYEGEAALRLEQLAGGFFRRHGLGSARPYDLDEVMPARRIDGRALIRRMAEELVAGADPAGIAARFHRTLAETVRQQARQLEVSDICFSGGVFQNEILVDLLQDILGKDSNLYFHQQLSPNDEGISFGQLILHLLETTSGKTLP